MHKTLILQGYRPHWPASSPVFQPNTRPCSFSLLRIDASSPEGNVRGRVELPRRDRGELPRLARLERAARQVSIHWPGLTARSDPLCHWRLGILPKDGPPQVTLGRGTNRIHDTGKQSCSTCRPISWYHCANVDVTSGGLIPCTGLGSSCSFGHSGRA